MPTIAVVAGETSGDIHAANLVAALRKLRPDVRVWGIGGERLREAGAEVIFDCARIASMGLTEAAGKLPALWQARKLIASRFRTDPPDLFIPVDFGGFNLKLTAMARQSTIPVVYFIPPKVWAWGGWRVKKVRETVDETLVILPFEADFWNGHGVKSTYVGSPVADHVGERRFDPEPDLVGLLPGSRMGEIKRLWPLLVESAKRLSAQRPLRFLAPRAVGLPGDCFDGVDTTGLDLTLVEGRAQEVMERSHLCLITSGTATLECALVGTPMVAVYRAGALSYVIGKRLVDVEFFTLPNLIARRRVIPELLQTGAGEVVEAARPLLDDTPARRAMIAGLEEVRKSIGAPGASERAARIVCERLEGATPP